MSFASHASALCCDKVETKFWWFGTELRRTCFGTHESLEKSYCLTGTHVSSEDMENEYEILSPDVFANYDSSEIISDESIRALTVKGNKEIKQLPERIHLWFPELEFYDAGFCSINRISKSNFEKLPHLRKLWLGSNQIEEIADDTFADAPLLEFLGLGIYFNCLFLKVLMS